MCFFGYLFGIFLALFWTSKNTSFLSRLSRRVDDRRFARDAWKTHCVGGHAFFEFWLPPIFAAKKHLGMQPSEPCLSEVYYGSQLGYEVWLVSRSKASLAALAWWVYAHFLSLWFRMTHTHTYIYTHIILYFILYICICMYTYAYIYDPWVGSPIRWSYLRVNVSIPGRFTLGAIAPAKHGIQNRRLRLPVVPRVETTWNNHIEWIKPDNLKTHERLWSSSLTFLIRFASLRRFCNSNWRAEWKILHAPYRMISILCGNQTCQTGTSPICISI